LTPLFDESPADFPIPLEVEAVDSSELICLQQSDTDLSALFDVVNKAEHPYAIRFGVLVRAWRNVISADTHIPSDCGPNSFTRQIILSVAHDIPAAGQLGVAKTKDRLLRHFYCPSISKGRKEFCRSCDVCQRLGKGAPSPLEPLHSLPSLGTVLPSAK